MNGIVVVRACTGHPGALKQLSARENPELPPLLLSRSQGTDAPSEVAPYSVINQALPLLSEAEYARLYAENVAFVNRACSAGELRCGISFSSVSLSRQMKESASSRPIARRKAEKMKHALLGYLTRACAKPSPFSSFAAVGVARVVNEPPKAMAPENWTLRSRVRIRRHIIDQLFLELLANNEFLLSIDLKINPSFKPGGDDQSAAACLVPPRWIRNENGAYSLLPEAYMKVKFPSSVAAVLRTLPIHTAVKASVFIRELTASCGTGTKALKLTRNLLEHALLLPQLPGSAPILHLEAALSQHLTHVAAPQLDEIQKSLERLVAFEESLVIADTDCEGVEKLQLALDETWSAMRRGTGDGSPAAYTETQLPIKHDCMVAPGRDGVSPLGTIPAGTVKQALSGVQLLNEVTYSFWPGHAYLHTAADALRRTYGSEARVPAWEFLQQTRGLWQAYTEHELACRDGRTDGRSFNPLGIEEIDELDALRAELLTQLNLALAENDDGSLRFDRARLWEIATMIPSRYKPMLPCTATLQAADSGMECWVLNGTAESGGRAVGRFIEGFHGTDRSDLVERLIRSSVWNSEADGRLALLDILDCYGDTLNVHPILTTYTLDISLAAHLGKGRIPVSISDLYIQLGRPEDAPSLRYLDGTRLLPVHLGGAASDFNYSTIARRLCVLGLNHFPLLDIVGRIAGARCGSRTPRVMVDNVILTRRGTVVHTSELPPAHVKDADYTFFTALNERRKDLLLPDSVFVRFERDPSLAPRKRKPQYIDFNSPASVAMLAGMLLGKAGFLRFEEALPNPAYAAHRTWEITVDPALLESAFGEREHKAAHDETVYA